MTVRRVKRRQSAVQNLTPARQGVFLIYVISKLEETPQSTTDDFFLCSQYLERSKSIPSKELKGPTGGASLDLTVIVLAAKAVSLKLCTAYASEPGVSCYQH